MNCPFCRTSIDNNPWHVLRCEAAPTPTAEELAEVRARHAEIKAEKFPYRAMHMNGGGGFER